MGMSATAGHGAHVGPKSTFSTLPPLTPQSQATRQEQTHQATSNTRHDQAKSGHPPPRTTRRQSSISANLHGVHQSPSAGIKAGNEGVRRLSTAKPNSTKAGAARKRRKKKKAKDQKDTALGAGNLLSKSFMLDVSAVIQNRHCFRFTTAYITLLIRIHITDEIAKCDMCKGRKTCHYPQSN